MSDRFSEHVPRKVTRELLDALQVHADEWVANARSTEPVTSERLVPAVHALYAAAGLKRPRVVIVPSPLAMAFAAGFAAAIWWARKNPMQAIGTGLAWASCYFPRPAPLPWTRQSIRSPMANAVCQAAELATQPYGGQTGLEGWALGKSVTTEGHRRVAAGPAADSAAGAAIERAAHNTCAWAADAVRKALDRDVVRNTQARPEPLDVRVLRDAAGRAAYEVAALAQAHESRNLEEAVRLFEEKGEEKEKGSMCDTPWGPFLPWKRAFYPGGAIDSILERQREPTRRALEAASHPTDPLADMAMLAYDLGANNGVDHLLLLDCAGAAGRRCQEGNLDAAVANHLGALCDVLGLVPPQYRQFKAWETCAVEGGPRFVHDEFCIVSDRPEVVKVDEQGRPHCADGPSHRWCDGWSLYHWHGIRIPSGQEFIILAPERITVAAIEAEFNAELRRVMIERYGAARYVIDSRATVVEELPPDHRVVGLRSARLLRKDHQKGARDEPILFVDLLNSTPEPDGTVKRYLLRVDPNAYGGEASRFIHAAVASTWRNADGSLTFSDWRDYDPDAES